ncbi:hypothetical protein [Flavobacterium aurantiibacter]|uniref:DUF4440 domain-containing protein n=1 Tax=Flavobacterium aurantiibacter TaxID=2023067 RepID=A0A255ZZD6_9FLAO|nr:hypothetical protein [Flavobacterium aurantiibacter]OYQ38465.1 hypothetical protein CHX27_15015 [Flavobacterium aurantiibacter]OYQ46160.1 hypothetical protein CHX27_04810 [Flavobacterium aurantiibacter]
MKKLFLFAVLFASSASFAQDSASPEKIVEWFFSGLNQKTPAIMRPLLLNESVNFDTLMYINGEPKVVSRGATDFLNEFSNIPQSIKLEERISNVIVRNYGQTADVHMDYEFYVNDTLQHSGRNYFFLVAVDGQWKIAHTYDTRKSAK